LYNFIKDKAQTPYGTDTKIYIADYETSL